MRNIALNILFLVKLKNKIMSGLLFLKHIATISLTLIQFHKLKAF